MIEQLLHHMSQAATHDLGITMPAMNDTGAGVVDEEARQAALRFTTPFYYRQVGHPFHIGLLIDPLQLPSDDVLTFSFDLPDGMTIEPQPNQVPVHELGNVDRMEWTVVAGEPARGEITARIGPFWAWCEVVVAEHASKHARGSAAVHPPRIRAPRDHGIDMFMGYEFRSLDGTPERAVYDARERKIVINTAAPTVQLYVDGRGHFRDSARLLLAELFMDVISDELARRLLERSGKAEDIEDFHAAKQDIICRYGSDIHRSFLSE